MEYLIGLLVFIFVLLPMITLVVNTLHVYGLKLIRGRFALIKEKDLKSFQIEQFLYGAKVLESMGFKFSHYHKYSDIVKHDNEPEVFAVYWHSEHNCYAEISNPKNPDTSRAIACRFINFYEKHSLVGMDREAEGVFKGCEQLSCVPISGHNFAELFDSYLIKKAEFESEYTTQDIPRLSARDYVARASSDADNYLRYLIKKSWVDKKKETKEDKTSIYLSFTFIASLKIAWQMMKEKTANKLLNQEVHETQRQKLAFLVQAEAKAHQRSDSFRAASKMKRLGKLLLFVASVFFFGLIFGIAWSPYLVLLLVPVLLFHELGHLLAMKRFGYRDLQILFMPFGAIAIGKKESPTVLQKTWVALAGPVPGLLLALVLVLWQPAFISNIYGIGLLFMLVVINYLNILPFMPLDGGHVVNTLLFDRWPSLQFVFKLFGVLVFAYFAWAWGDPILTFLAVFLAFGLKNNWREYQVVKQLNGSEIEQLNEFDQLTKIYACVEKQNTLFQDKMILASAVMQRFKHAKPKLRETVLGMTVYLFFLITPVVFIDKYMDMDLLALFSTDSEYASDEYYEYEGIDTYDEEKWDITYYQSRIDAALTDEQKKSVLEEAMTFALSQEYDNFIWPLAADAVSLYEINDWHNEAHFKDWKRVNLTAQIFESYEETNLDALKELEILMADDQAGFYSILTQTLYQLESHPYETKLKSYMESQRQSGNWGIYVDCLLALNVLKQNRGESEAVILALKKAMNDIPDSEIHPRIMVTNSYLVALFADKQYQEILASRELLTHSFKEEYQPYFHYAVWAAIELNDLKAADLFLTEYRRKLEQMDEEIMESVGFLGRMVLSQQNLSQYDALTSPIQMAIAELKGDDAEAKRLLDLYIETSYLNEAKDEQMKARLESMVAMTKTETLSPTSLQMKYIIAAIKKYQPELLKNITGA
jgi:Zn-dependent protease